jgi:hypothetical protein
MSLPARVTRVGASVRDYPRTGLSASIAQRPMICLMALLFCMLISTDLPQIPFNFTRRALFCTPFLRLLSRKLIRAWLVFFSD